MHYYLTMFTRGSTVVEHGWMLASPSEDPKRTSADELVNYARVMGYGLDMTYLGEADMTAVTPTLVPGTESDAARELLGVNR